jgi:alkylresorcinol/alkylpyrone synthase
MATIAATATGFPSYYYSQAELTAALSRFLEPEPHQLERLEQFHHNTRVGGRYLALPLEAYSELSDFGTRNNYWIQEAAKLAKATICDLLEQVDLPAQEVSHLVFTTVTGIAVPSLDARLMNCISFSPNLKRVPLFGLGCLGGAAGVARAADLLRGDPTGTAVLLAVELCSLTFQKEDLSIANLISSGLFGDGAAAVLLVGADHPLAQAGPPQVIDSRSFFFPDTEQVMGWMVDGKGFQVMLSPEVVPITRYQLRPVVEGFLADHGLEIDDITHWIAHPGGPKVMQAMQEGLGLAETALQASEESLARAGNVSSASVLFVLDHVLTQCQPAPGSYGLMIAMGPAFCAELVLLKW